MISFFKSLFGKNMESAKPIKVQNADGSRKIGVVVKSLSDLRGKIQEKFQLRSKKFKIVEEDGTEVCDGDYFSLLKPQTVLIVIGEGEVWKPGKDTKRMRLEEALKALIDSNELKDLADGVANLLKTEKSPENRDLLAKIAESARTADNISAETRKQDPDWFKGMSKTFKTKEQAMEDNAKRRTRSYYYVASEYVKSNVTKAEDSLLKRLLEEILELFRKELKNNDYYGDYFSRASLKEEVRFCDDEGWFSCEGAYSVANCQYLDHMINPYGSRQSRILFSTWNLDHRIEKSREIMPQLLRAVQNIPESKEFNWIYFYKILFTRKNLRLVHIACHDKTEHSDKCDPKEFFI